MADRNPDSMHDPDSRVNPSTCTKDAEEPLFVARQVDIWRRACGAGSADIRSSVALSGRAWPG